jgi:hypothetical protein
MTVEWEEGLNLKERAQEIWDALKEEQEDPEPGHYDDLAYDEDGEDWL